MIFGNKKKLLTNIQNGILYIKNKQGKYMDKNNILETSISQFKDQENKFNLALELANGDLEKAKKLISGEIKDIAVLKGNFIEKSLKMYGLYIFYVDLNNRLVDRIFTAIAFNPLYENVSPYMNWQDFEKKLIELEWNGNNMSSQSRELKSNISSYINYEYMDKFIEAVKNNEPAILKNIMFEVISKSLQINTFKNEISLELINKFLLRIAGLSEDKKDDKENIQIKEEKEEDLKEEENKLIRPDEIILDGFVEISPIRGINLTKLKAGDKILIKLDDTTPQQKFYINKLGATDGKKIFPIITTVRGIIYDETFGYFVISEIKPGLVVRCIEQTPINVMTPEILEKEKKNKILKIIIFVSGALVIILAAIYLLYFT